MFQEEADDPKELDGKGWTRLKKLLLWGLPAILLVAFIVWRFVGLNAAKALVAKQQGGGGGAATVQITSSSSRLIVQTIQSVGNVESPYKVEISPKSAGRIEFLEAREGDSVQPGQILLKIDPSDLQGAVLQQRASVAEAQARYAQAKLTQNSTTVGVTSEVQQQQAALASARANYAQLRENYDAQVSGAQAQVSSADSTVANARASLTKEKSTLTNLQTRYQRVLSLYNQNFIAAQDLDDARTAVNVQKDAVTVAQGLLAGAESQLKVQQQNLLIVKRKGLADIAAGKATVTAAQATLRTAQANRSQTPAYQQNLEALLSQVTAAEAQLNQAQARLSDTVIASTIAGTVTARKADPGALASPGTPVLEVQFLDWLYVTATLPIDFSAQIHPGQIAEITIDGLPGKTFSGPIANINPAADPTSRQFGIKVRLDNRDHAVRPGMYGRVKIVTGRVNAGVVVPREAVQTASDGSTTVTVIGKDKIAHVRPVKLGVSDETGIQVTDGVQLGDQVVVLTFNPLKEGQKVTIASKGGSGTKGTSGGVKESGNSGSTKKP